MKTFFTVGILATIICPAGLSGEPYGRTGLFVVERKGDPKQPTAVTARTYVPEIEPGEGKSLRLFADISVPGAILLVAFDRTSGLVLRKAPPIIAVHKEGFGDAVYPLSGYRLLHDGKKSLDFHVIVFREADPEIAEIRPLVEAIGKSAQSSGATDVFSLQCNELKKKIDSWVRKANADNFVLRYQAPATAGLQRGSSIIWREQAITIKPFYEDTPTVRLFRVGEESS